MPEPTSTTIAAAHIAAGTVAIPMLTAFGIPLGLRADLLIAGFGGSLVAIALLNSVPSTGDTIRHLLYTTWRRMVVCMASSLTAGYLAPMFMLMTSIPESYIFGGSFMVGAGAQQLLNFTMREISARMAKLSGSNSEVQP